jgi:hypothetical protein
LTNFDFDRSLICKHSVATMIEVGEIAFPQNFKGMPLEARRKRGRPRRIFAALVRDD